MAQESIRERLKEHNFSLPPELAAIAPSEIVIKKPSAVSVDPARSSSPDAADTNSTGAVGGKRKKEKSSSKLSTTPGRNGSSLSHSGTPTKVPPPPPPLGKSRDVSGAVSVPLPAVAGVRGDRVRGPSKTRTPSSKALSRYQTRPPVRRPVGEDKGDGKEGGDEGDEGKGGEPVGEDVSSEGKDEGDDVYIPCSESPALRQSNDYEVSQMLIAAAMARDREEEEKAVARQSGGFADEDSSPLLTDADERRQRLRLEELLEIGKSMSADFDGNVSGYNNNGTVYEEDFEEEDDEQDSEKTEMTLVRPGADRTISEEKKNEGLEERAAFMTGLEEDTGPKGG